MKTCHTYPTPAAHSQRLPLALHCLATVCVITVALAAGFGVVARAANPPAVQKYYVPFPEDQLLICFTNIWFDRTPIYTTTPQTLPPVNPMTTYLSVTINAAGTLVYYDHWEDGYEPSIDSPVQITTQVWGDGNPANGSAPGFVGDTLAAGDVILLYNQLNSTTLQAVLDYDGRDKIGASKAISVTRTGWSTGPETLMAGAIEVFSSNVWGADYRAPVGENIPDSVSNDQFDYVALIVSAGEGGATVKVDLNGDDDFSDPGDIATLVLSEGDSYLVDGGVNLGAHVVSFDPANPGNAGNPVQVIIFAGDEGSNYETRDSSLLPTTSWGTSYYTPVSTASSVTWTGFGTLTPPTVVWLYNPNGVSITVNRESRVLAGAISTGSVTVPANGYAKVALVENAAYHFSSDSVFYGFSCTDANTTQTAGGSGVTQYNQAWDWGFSLIPESSLSSEFQCGLGIGRDPTAVLNPSENGNPVWVTTVGNPDTNNNGQKDDTVVVYVDYNGDGQWNGSGTDPGLDPNGNGYDLSYNLLELQQQKLFDADGDQTGMRVYVLTAGVTIVGAWGQDPRVASPSTPGLDVGTSIPPLPRSSAGKTASLVGDADDDGLISPGDTIEYDVRAVNASLGSLSGGVVLVDSLPTDTVYVAGSTKYRVSTDGGLGWGDWVAISDDGSGTPFPLDGDGLAIEETLPLGEQFQVVFQVTIETFGDLDPGRTEIVNEGTVEFPDYLLILPLYCSNPLYGSLGDRVWHDADQDGDQDSGETGLNDVRVYIDLNDNGVYDAGEPSDVTSGDGDYLISGLPAGTYTVHVDPSTLPAGYGPTDDLDGIDTANVATVPLDGGQDRVDVDFGYRPGGSLGDRVWLDRDNDGVQEDGEPGLNGVRVFLDDGDGVFEASEPYAITAGDGTYTFGGLDAGTYIVCIDTSTLPGGLTQTFDRDGVGTAHTATVSLGVSEVRTDVDFGYRGAYSLGDLVWNDVNGNGIYSIRVYDGRIDMNLDGAGNTGDDGWITCVATIIDGQVDLDGDGTVSGDTGDTGWLGTRRVINGRLDIQNDGDVDINDDGSYLGIPIINGYFDMDRDGATPVDTGDDGSIRIPIEVIDGRLDMNANGNISTDGTDDSRYQGVVVNDGYVISSTYDGTVIDIGEVGISGVRVFIDTNGNGVYDGSEAFAVTDASGNYTIGNLQPGTYTVRVDTSTLPAGYTQTYDLDGVPTPHVAAATITNANLTDVDFGYRDRASVGDRVWNDVNGDGDDESGGESGIPDVRVYIDKNGDNLYTFGEPFAITDDDGYYTIDNLDPGTYSVRVDLDTMPEGALPTYDLDSGTTNPNHEASRTLASGENADNVDFGYRLTATGSVGDFVWLDLNNNGVWNTGEPGIEGVLVYIDSNGNGVYDSGEPSDTTDASGLYLIDNLVQGAYTVRVDPSTLPAGVTQTYDLNGDLDHQADIGLATGESRTDVDYGYAPPARIGDYVWVDANGNGVQESGEAPLPGVSVQVYRASDNTLAGSDTTDANGAWEVGGLPPGTYYVKFTAPSGYSFTSADVGSDTADSDANPSTGQTGNYTLVAGQYNQTVDAGLYQPASIGDYTWMDTNANGVQDSGEPPLPGVLVEVYRTSDNALMGSDTSDASGAWNVSGLAPGTYYVKFTLPTDYEFTLANQGGNDATDSDANPATGQTGNYTLVSGDDNLTVDAGAVQYDFADLPDTGSGTGVGNYQTMLADSGPYHNITLGALYLGAAVDPETDGQPNATATGDDVNGTTDDEDGVVLPVFTAGQTATIQITSSGAGYVNAFIDWNRDGDFLDEGEDLTTEAVTGDPKGLPVVAGVNTLSVTVPPGAVTGELLGAMFRVSSAGDLGPTGYAPDGEVETYLVAVAPSDVCPVSERSPWTGALWNPTLNGGAGDFVPNILGFDWASTGSANLQGLGALLNGGVDPTAGTKFTLRYQSRLAGVTLIDSSALPLDETYEYTIVMDIPMEVASHDLSGEPPFYPNTLVFRTLTGGRFDIYFDAQPNADVADGIGFDDGALVATGALETSKTGSLTVTSSTAAQGSFTVRGTTAYANPAYLDVASIIDGISISLTLNYPPVDSETDWFFPGRQGEGNLVDYEVVAADLPLKADGNSRFTLCADYGDLPDTYKTVLASDGARHAVGGVYLGTVAPDTETNGQPTANATGDDVNGTPDDEDGVVFGTMVAGGLGTVTVTASAAGYLNAWADWNNNGVFDTGERIFSDQTLAPGSQTLTFSVPSDAALANVAFRFRVTDAIGQGGDSPTGLATTGEVEDYFASGLPTAATLDYFRAQQQGERVALSWGTFSEFDMLGFRIERLAPEGGWQEVTPSIIAAEAWDNQPHDYRYAVPSVLATPGLRYRLVGVDLSGSEKVLAEATVDSRPTLAFDRLATGMQVTVQGPSRARMVIERTVSVTRGPWVEVGTVDLDSMGQGALRLNSAPAQPIGFYRAREQ